MSEFGPDHCQLCRQRAGLIAPPDPIVYEQPKVRARGEPCTCSHCTALLQEGVKTISASDLEQLSALRDGLRAILRFGLEPGDPAAVLPEEPLVMALLDRLAGDAS